LWIVGGIVTLVYLIGVTGRWWPTPDSALYLGLARALVRRQGYQFNGEPCNAVTPGLPVILAVCRKLFGAVYWAPNLLMTICGLATLSLIYRVISYLGDRRTALMVVICCAFSYTFYISSHRILTDAPFALFFWATLYACLRARRGSLWWLLMAMILAAAGLLIRAPGALVFGSLTAGLLADWPRRTQRRKLLLAGVAFLVVAVAATAVLYRIGRASGDKIPLYAKPFQLLMELGPSEVVRRLGEGMVKVPYATSELFTGQEFLSFGLVAIGLVVIGGAALWARGQRMGGVTVVVSLFLLMILGGAKSIRPRYLLPLQGILAYMMLEGLGWVVRAFRRRGGETSGPRVYWKAAAILTAFVMLINAPRLFLNAVYYSYLSHTPRYYKVINQGRSAEHIEVGELLYKKCPPNSSIAVPKQDVPIFHYLTDRQVVSLPETRQKSADDAKKVVRFIIRSPHIPFFVVDAKEERTRFGKEKHKYRKKVQAGLKKYTMKPIRSGKSVPKPGHFTKQYYLIRVYRGKRYHAYFFGSHRSPPLESTASADKSKKGLPLTHEARGPIYKVNHKKKYFLFLTERGRVKVKWTDKTLIHLRSYKRLEDLDSAGQDARVYGEGNRPAVLARGVFKATHLVIYPSRGKIKAFLPTNKRANIIAGVLRQNRRVLQLSVGGRTIEMRTLGRPKCEFISPDKAPEIKPFVLGCEVFGKDTGRYIVADRIALWQESVPQDDPGLPRALIIGDSVSVHYHPHVVAALKGKANVHRITGNGRASMVGVKNIHRWLGAYWLKGHHWDVIQFNHGLHDLRGTRGVRSESGNTWYSEPWVSIGQYKKNLEYMISQMQKTGAKIIWATTTPMWCDYQDRKKGAEAAYNQAALEVMRKHAIPVNDLWGACQGKYPGKWGNNPVHPFGEGPKVLGQLTAEAILTAVRQSAVERMSIADYKKQLPLAHNAHGPVYEVNRKDKHFMFLTEKGRVKVKWTDKTSVTFRFDKTLGDLPKDGQDARIHGNGNSAEIVSKGVFSDADHFIIYPTRGKLAAFLPTKERLNLISGVLRREGKVLKLTAGKRVIDVRTRSQPRIDWRVFTPARPRDIKPFVIGCEAFGKDTGGYILADRLQLWHRTKVQDDPSLPRALVIGDSISEHFHPHLAAALRGKVNIHRIPVNAWRSTFGVAQIHRWLGPYWIKGHHWDAIQFNYGLHDLRGTRWIAGGSRHVWTDKPRVPLWQYRKNLEYIISQLKRTGARLIWATITPVTYDSRGRKKGDEAAYNKVALKIMKKHGIQINGLWQACQGNFPGKWGNDPIHPGGEGPEVLGRLTARSILKTLRMYQEPRPPSRKTAINR
jgi:acyl-CoA thioesterase-1